METSTQPIRFFFFQSVSSYNEKREKNQAPDSLLILFCKILDFLEVAWSESDTWESERHWENLSEVVKLATL